MPDHDSTAWLNAKVDESLRNSLEWNRSQRLKLEKALRKAVKALESARGFVLVSDHPSSDRVVKETEAALAEIKGALGDE